MSESSLKRWADGGRLRFSRTAGGHRRFSIAEAVRFVREAGLPVRDPAGLGLPPGPGSAGGSGGGSGVVPPPGPAAASTRTLVQTAAAVAGPGARSAVVLADAGAGGDAACGPPETRDPETEAQAAAADAPPAVPGRPAVDQLTGLLRCGHDELARGLIVGLYLQGHDAGWIFDRVLTPTLARFGELWRHDDAGIYAEHRAFDVCLRAVHELRALMPPPPPEARVALGGTPPGDLYLMPSAMAATVLAGAGFRDVNLGAQVPADVLVRAAVHYRAALVWLSLSCRKKAPGTAELDELAARLHEHGAALVVGGRAGPRRTGGSGSGAAGFRRVGDMQGLVAAAGAWARPLPPA